MDVKWTNLKAREIRELQGRNAIAIVPIGSIEQHGPHLPVSVDALLVTEVACRAALRVREIEPVVVLPTIWSGLAEHHMSLGGTITLDLATFFALVRSVVGSLARSGFRRIFILNGHGGNMAALAALVGELSHELDLPIALATYWMLVPEAFAEILELQPSVLHACEAETSMLLALRPDLVDMTALADINPPAAWSGLGDAVQVWSPVESWSPSGVAGSPRAASAEKGRKLLDAAASALAARLTGEGPWAKRGSDHHGADHHKDAH
jgi:creatinine amidohydrolase